MIKVTLLGDSIRQLGYGTRVPTLLGDEFEVFQPSENCRFAKHTLRGLYDWSKGISGSKVIHWNNGLWDVCRLYEDGETFSSVSEYVETMLRIASLLKARCDTLIFATTTPARAGRAYIDNADILRFNEALVPKLQAMGVVINDLHTLVSKDPDAYICDDLLHLSEKGIGVCAEQVAEMIRRYAVL